MSAKEFNSVGLYSSPITKTLQLHAVMDCILKEKTDVPLVIMGDFNIDTPVGGDTHIFSFMKKKYNCDQYVKQCTTKYNTTIDLVFSNYPHQEISILDCYWSDYDIIYTVTDDSNM